MRKMMSKEVTFTSCKVAKIEMVDGTPQAVELGTETFMGNLSEKKVEKEIVKMYGVGVSIYDYNTRSVVYEMEVEEFIKYATVKEEQNEQV